jgi:hypothetical protein
MEEKQKREKEEYIKKLIDSKEDVLAFQKELEKRKDQEIINSPVDIREDLAKIKYYSFLNQKPLDYLKEKYDRQNLKSTGRIIKISKRAEEVANKDNSVRNILGKFKEHIKDLAKEDLDNYKSDEKIGDFNILRINEKYRLVWNYNKKEKTLEILDLLYHTSNEEYGNSKTANWISKIKKGIIKEDYYKKLGYSEKSILIPS